MFMPHQHAASAGGVTVALYDAALGRPEVLLLSRLTGCAACLTVETTFKVMGVPYRKIDIDAPENAEQVKALLATAKVRALPLMFIDGENVAGGLACIVEVQKHGY